MTGISADSITIGFPPLNFVYEQACTVSNWKLAKIELSTPEGIPAPWRVTTVLFWLAVASYLTLPLFNPGIFFDIVVGRWIAFQGALPVEDHWTIVGEGRTWRAAGWLFSLLPSFAYKAYGFQGVVALKLLLVVVFFAALRRLYLRIAGDPFVAGLLSLFILCGSLVSYSFDRELLSWILFSVLLGLSIQWERGPQIWTLLATATTAIIASNSSLFSVCIFLSVAAFALGRSSLRSVAVYILMLGISLVATPYGGLDLLDAARGEVLRCEYLLRQGRIFEGGYYGFGFILLIFLSALLISSQLRKFLRHPAVPVLGVIVCVSVVDTRYLPYGLMLLGALAAEQWAASEGMGRESIPLAGLRLGIVKLREHCRRVVTLSPHGFAWLFLCVVIVNTTNLIRTPMYRQYYPVQEAGYLEEHRELLPVFHTSEIGAYLIFRWSDEIGVPRERALIDNRAWTFASDQAERIGAARAKDLINDQLPTSVRAVLIPRISEIAQELGGLPQWREEPLLNRDPSFWWALFRRVEES